MGTQPFWGDEAGAESWDICVLGGFPLPGIATVETDVARKIDLKPIKGEDGSSLDDAGYENATVTITLQLWTADQWDAWQWVQGQYHPRTKGGPRDPLEIIHPEPNAKGVTQVYVKRLPPIRVDKKIGTIVLECVEWFEKPKPKKTGKGYAQGYDSKDPFYQSAKTQAEAGGSLLNDMLLAALQGS